MAQLLDDSAVTAALKDLPGWERDGDALVLTAALPSFPAAIGVVDRVAEEAEARNHHPDIDIRWRNLLDTALAAAISETVSAAGG